MKITQIQQVNSRNVLLLLINTLTSNQEQNLKSYLDKSAVAVARRLRIKVIMVIDVDEATDDRLQGSAVLLDLPHAHDQALGDGAVRQIGRRAHEGDDIVADRLQGCEQSLVIHVGGCEDKGRQELYRTLFTELPPPCDTHCASCREGNPNRANREVPIGVIDCFFKKKS